ncbi:hypothetical protein GSQ54_03455 [Clostridioides difficile]|uniref:hypothetical protein n=1 Tax=unclassified Clostridioides TaxID=2635829 RepID=UPI00143061A2|nr:hypothetical protein [Clostridioides difficile]NJJ37308.1 hypothetical protein [Clostridioides difficile]NJK12616.1 hypothetical protein [Clostridioides difficile]
MFKDMMDECVHTMTAYIFSLEEYDLFIETQVEDFITKYGEDVVESCMHNIMILLCKLNLN